MTDPDAVCVKHVYLLLDGRSLNQLGDQVRSMFTRMGYNPTGSDFFNPPPPFTFTPPGK
jgi:hypothetical protein